MSNEYYHLAYNNDHSRRGLEVMYWTTENWVVGSAPVCILDACYYVLSVSQ